MFTLVQAQRALLNHVLSLARLGNFSPSSGSAALDASWQCGQGCRYRWANGTLAAIIVSCAEPYDQAQ